ncbi:MAG: twin-arginine translocase subunit TatB [Rhizobiales bacterium]|nr:twin-arginine translocase subunit TatB [Hyphomicrobiales bacterium]
MFDLGWSELLVIAVVAIIVVGPRDLPVLLRNVGRFVGQMRRMANEFTRHFNEAVRESELDDVRKKIGTVTTANPLKDIAQDVKKAVEPVASVADKARAAVAEPSPSAATTGAPPKGTAGGAAPSAGAASPATPAANTPTTASNVTPMPVAAAKTEAASADGTAADGAKRGRVAERAEQAWKAAANDDSANQGG